MLLRICFSLSLSLDNKETIGSTSARCRIKLETDLTVARLPCLIFDLVLRLLRQHPAGRRRVAPRVKGLGGIRWEKKGEQSQVSRSRKVASLDPFKLD